MTIPRERPGVTVEMVAVAKERVLPKSGVVLVPYQAEWGAPDTIVRMYGDEERYNETLGLVDTIELAADGGATILGYRITNGNATAAKYTQDGAVEVSARYAGTYGNNLKVVILASDAEPGKKELQVKDATGILERFSFADADELVSKADQSIFIRVKKLGTTAIADVAETSLANGVSGTAGLTAADFTKLFNAISGADFDTLHLPTDDPAIQASGRQFMKDRRTLNKKLSTEIIGGNAEEDTDMSKHTARSVAQNARYVVNCALAGEHNNGTYYNSIQWGAWVAGMVAATPADQSLTGIVVPMKKAAKDWGHTEILNALSTGTLIAVRDGDVYVIESAVNTLSTLGPDEREDYGKIRVSMTLDQIVNDINTVGKKYKGKLDNNDLGGSIFVGAVKKYMEVREEQGAIDTGWTFEDKKNGEGDRRGFKLSAKPLDAIENFDVEWEVQ